MDAQGFDYSVLRGAEGLLRERRVGVLTTEFYPAQFPGGLADADALAGMLASHGYSCAMCREARGPLRASEYARKLLGSTKFDRGVNISSWDDLVCSRDARGAATLAQWRRDLDDGAGGEPATRERARQAWRRAEG